MIPLHPVGQRSGGTPGRRWLPLTPLASAGGAFPQKMCGFAHEQEMTDKPVTTYVVSVYLRARWRTVITTKDRAKAQAMAKDIGDRVQIEEITPKPKKRIRRY